MLNGTVELLCDGRDQAPAKVVDAFTGSMGELVAAMAKKLPGMLSGTMHSGEGLVVLHTVQQRSVVATLHVQVLPESAANALFDRPGGEA
jgi:cytoskeletal protein CcmA (bactofilin family)